MTETIGYMIGAVSLAGVLTGIAAALDKPRFQAFAARYTKRAIVQRLAHWLMVKDAGWEAQATAERLASEKTVRLG